MRPLFRYATFCFGFGELLFYGSFIFGWSTLVYVLKKEGYYGHLCTNETTIKVDTANESSGDPVSCTRQDAILNLVFTVGTFSMQGSVFFNGLIFDNFGTRFLRLLLQFFLISGFLMMTFSSASIPQLIFPGMVCISIGGYAIIFTNMQIGNLFGNQRATVMTILSGCISSSSFVTLLIKLGYEAGISLETSFGTLAGAILFFFINTLVFLPKHPIPWPLPLNYGKRKEHIIESLGKNRERKQEGVVEIPPCGIDRGSLQLAETQKNVDFPTVISCILSPLFWLLVFWFSVLQLRMLFFFGTLNAFLVHRSNGDEIVVRRYTRMFSFFQFCSVFVAPFSGMILDRNKLKQGFSLRGPYEDLQDSGLAFTVTTSLYVLFSILDMIPIIEVFYILYLLQVLTRAFMFALADAGIPLFFPSQYFGTLYGLLLGVSSVIGLLQFPLFIASQTFMDKDKEPVVVNLVLLAACIVTIILPIYIHLYAKRKSKEVKDLKTQCREIKKGIDNPCVVEMERSHPMKV